MPISNTDFADDFVDALTAHGVTVTDAAGLKAALITLLPQWNDGSVSRTALMAALSEQIDVTNVWIGQLLDWWTGTLTGGPNSDGTYPFTDKFGVTTFHPCPVKMMDTAASGAIETMTALASEAAASQTAAAASQAAAATSAGNAHTSEVNAAVSAASATTESAAALASQMAAAGSAATAGTAATAAAAARDAALAAFTDFDTRYLGEKASDPTLDNEGHALVGGALYFNTVTDVMKVYVSSGLGWIDSYVAGTDVLLKSQNLADGNAVTMRTNLGLGTSATVNTGTSGAAIPVLNAANTWSAAQTFSSGLSGALTGNVTGSSGSCTGNAATASVAAIANSLNTSLGYQVAGFYCTGEMDVSGVLRAGTMSVGGAANVVGAFSGSNTVAAAQGFVTQAGAGGSPSGYTFNIDWNGSGAFLWIGDTVVGQITLH